MLIRSFHGVFVKFFVDWGQATEESKHFWKVLVERIDHTSESETGVLVEHLIPSIDKDRPHARQLREALLLWNTSVMRWAASKYLGSPVS